MSGALIAALAPGSSLGAIDFQVWLTLDLDINDVII